MSKRFSQLTDEFLMHSAHWDLLSTDAIVVGSAPHYHIYGLLFRIVFPLLSGRVFRDEPVTAAAGLNQVAQVSDAVIFVTTPSAAAHIDWPQVTASAAKFAAVFSSGGQLAQKNAEILVESLGCSLSEIYGSTETGGIAYKTWRRGEAAPAYWHNLPDVETSADDIGLLLVRSPATGGVWTATADVVAMAPNGDFELIGRSDRIVKIAERRISLRRIEEIIESNPNVDCAAAVCGRNKNREGIYAAVQLSEAGKRFVESVGNGGLNASLTQSLAQHIPAVALPKLWRHVEALPKTPLGKISFAAVAELFAAEDTLSTEPFVSLICRDAESVRLQLTFPADLLYFSGHFPEDAILPGVVQTHWAVTYATKYLGIARPFAAIEKLKFTNVIRPHQDCELYLSATGDVLRFEYSNDEKSFSAGSIRFGDGD